MLKTALKFEMNIFRKKNGIIIPSRKKLKNLKENLYEKNLDTQKGREVLQKTSRHL